MGQRFSYFLVLTQELCVTGNKTDREDREIPTHVGEDFAQRHNMYYLETSAKEAENVERLFMQIAAELMEVRIVKYTDLRIISKMVASNKFPHNSYFLNKIFINIVQEQFFFVYQFLPSLWSHLYAGLYNFKQATIGTS